MYVYCRSAVGIMDALLESKIDYLIMDLEGVNAPCMNLLIRGYVIGYSGVPQAKAFYPCGHCACLTPSRLHWQSGTACGDLDLVEEVGILPGPSNFS